MNTQRFWLILEPVFPQANWQKGIGFRVVNLRRTRPDNETRMVVPCVLDTEDGHFTVREDFS